MRKMLSLLLAGLLLTGCTATKPETTPAPSGNHGCDAFEECADEPASDTKAAAEFKVMYEALNGTENKNGKVNRTIAIPEDHPFVYTTPEDVVQKIENKETFWLYVGDPKCPWCRSVLETAAAKAKEYGVKEIVSVNIWDEDGNEILRDKYELQDGKPVKTGEGTEAYQKLLTAFDALLEDYQLETEDGQKIPVGEKRIYAPNFVRIVNGEAVKLITGISDKQKDSRGELSEEILADEKAAFDSFFKE